MTSKMTLQNDPSKRAPLIHAHKAQDRAEIRYMKRVKTEFLSSKLVRFSKQISNANISAPRRDNPSKFSLRGRPESQLWRRHPNLYTRRIKTTSRWQDFIIQDSSLSFRDSFDVLGTSGTSIILEFCNCNMVCTTNNLDCLMLWTNKLCIVTGA